MVLLNHLAHNVLMWARNRLSEVAPRLARFGILRLVRDLPRVGRMIELKLTRVAVTARLARHSKNRSLMARRDSG